jgi:hypothetical protein
MNRLALAAALALAACTGAKAPATDDFSSLDGVDTKSDAFSKHLKLVGSLNYGDTSDDVSYHNPPRYRAFKFGGNPGDQVDVWVRSSDGGDAVTWLVTNSWKIVAKNDDADGTTLDSHLTATLPGNTNPDIITYYIVFRDYSESDATFTVSLDGSAPSFDACKVDSDCVAISKGGCCPNGFKVAVNKNEVAAYNAANACANPHPICPLFLINDTRIAECNFATHKCEMIAPGDVHCAGFITPTHSCAAGYSCLFSGVPDVGGTCTQLCGGIAARPCTDPAHPNCVDDPRDSCDPTAGGADCGGICQ